MPPAAPPDSHVRNPFAEVPSSAWGRREWIEAPVTVVIADNSPVDDNSGKDSMTKGIDSMNCGSRTHLAEEVDALVMGFGEQLKALVSCHAHLSVPQGEQAKACLIDVEAAVPAEQEANSSPGRFHPSRTNHRTQNMDAIGTVPTTSRASMVRVTDTKTVREIVKETAMMPSLENECLFEASRIKFQQNQTWLQRLTRSQLFEWCSGALIIANALFIGVQTQYAANQTLEAGMAGQTETVDEAPGSLIGSALFTLLFTMELLLHWMSEGFFGLFQSQDGNWFLCDLAILILSWVDAGASLLHWSQGSTGQKHIFSSITVSRILRMARIIKLIRVVRILSFFHELRLMVHSIFNSLKPLIWLTVILLCTFYVFAVMFTSGVASHDSPQALWNDESLHGVRESFATLDRSILSLYMGMSGGRDWGDYYMMLRESLPVQYAAIFLLFMTFNIFAVMNAVTAVFVELAMRGSNDSRQVAINEELNAKKKFLRDLHNLFHEMDVDGDGCISNREFKHKLDDERVIAYFKALNLDIHDTQALFQLLDTNQSETVDSMEFLNGCYQLQGEARSIDTKMIRMTLERLFEQMCALRQAQNEQKVLLAQQANPLASMIYRANHLSGHAAAGASKGNDSKLYHDIHAAFGNDRIPTNLSDHAALSHAQSEGSNTKRTQLTAAKPQQGADMLDEMKQRHNWDQVMLQKDG